MNFKDVGEITKKLDERLEDIHKKVVVNFPNSSKFKDQWKAFEFQKQLLEPLNPKLQKDRKETSLVAQDYIMVLQMFNMTKFYVSVAWK